MISVIIPCYNREDTIERAIFSVLKQKQKNGEDFDLEVLVVDDCSSDESVEKVKAISDKRVKLIQLEKNSGANRARNIGIENSSGQYIAFHDSDDEWLADKLWKQLEFLDQSNADLVACALSWRGGVRGNHELRHQAGRIYTSDLLSGNFLSTQTLLMKSELLKMTKFDETLPRLQDWDLVFRLSLQYKICFLDQVLVYQYPTENSISKSDSAKFRAAQMIEEKFTAFYQMNKKEQAAFYNHLGDLMHSRDQFKKSFKARPNFEALRGFLFGK